MAPHSTRILRVLALFALPWLTGPPVVAAAGTGEPLTVRLIPASDTGPGIEDVNGVHHVALGPPETRLGRLLVFLPGTTAEPQFYSLLIERAATLGYHAIGLSYKNELAVNALCFGMGASGCHEQVRREVLFGGDESDLVDVDRANSLFNRLEALLDHLEALAPEEDWEIFREASGRVRWPLVLVSGHSQGAGHAAFIGRLQRVARAVLFSGTEPASWTQAGDFATPGQDYFGFAHVLEQSYAPILRSWDQIGLPGEPTSVDGAAPPFGGSHQLETATEECTGDPTSNGFYHNCHCADDWMPFLPDGTPLFQEVWDHLFAPPGGPAPVPSLGTPARIALLIAVLGLGLTRSLAPGRASGQT
ncbi:MAG: BPSS1187 family protein [Myxococcota bacterium]